MTCLPVNKGWCSGISVNRSSILLPPHLIRCQVLLLNQRFLLNLFCSTRFTLPLNPNLPKEAPLIISYNNYVTWTSVTKTLEMIVILRPDTMHYHRSQYKYWNSNLYLNRPICTTLWKGRHDPYITYNPRNCRDYVREIAT